MCKIKVISNLNDLQLWLRYKDNIIFTPEEDSYRVTIRNKQTESRLVIKDLTTLDSGKYRCEVSNGLMRIFTTAELKVSFSKLPMQHCFLHILNTAS